MSTAGMTRQERHNFHSLLSYHRTKKLKQKSQAEKNATRAARNRKHRQAKKLRMIEQSDEPFEGDEDALDDDDIDEEQQHKQPHERQHEQEHDEQQEDRADNNDDHNHNNKNDNDDDEGSDIEEDFPDFTQLFDKRKRVRLHNSRRFLLEVFQTDLAKVAISCLTTDSIDKLPSKTKEALIKKLQKKVRNPKARADHRNACFVMKQASESSNREYRQISQTVAVNPGGLSCNFSPDSIRISSETTVRRERDLNFNSLGI